MNEIEATTQMQTSRTQQLVQDVRRGAIGRAIIPMEAATGWPLPYRRHERAYIVLPFYSTAGTGRQGETAIFPPLLTVTLDWQTGRPVEYVDLRFRGLGGDLDFDKPVGTFPHAAVAAMTTGEYQQKRDALYRLYDQLLDSVALADTLPPFWLQEFSELFQVLLEPSLEPFYRAIAPKFCEQFLIGQGSR